MAYNFTTRRKEIEDASKEAGAVQEYNKEAAKKRLFAEVAAREKVETKKVRKQQSKQLVEGVKKAFKETSEGGVIKKILKKQPRTGAGARRVIRKAVTMASGMGGVSKFKKTGSKTGKRGRPSGTFKVRYLPSGRAVKVPTHIYKKMLAAERTQMRLARAQRQQYAEQVAMQQDPRFQQDVQDQFLAEQDQEHEMNVARAQAGYPILVEEQTQPAFQRAQSIGSRVIRGISSIGGVRAQQEQVVDQYGRTMPVRPQPQPQGQGLVREPRVSVFSPHQNILNAPNIFNNPGESELLLPRRRRRIS